MSKLFTERHLGGLLCARLWLNSLLIAVNKMPPLPKAQRAVMLLLRKLWLNLELLTLRGYPGKILSLFSVAGISAPTCQAHTGHQKITTSRWTNSCSAAKACTHA